MNYTDEFKAAMRAAGYEPPDDIIPGKWHRFSSNGKRSDTAGFCKLFDDMRGGIFGDHRTGESVEWQANKASDMTPKEREDWRRHVEQARKDRELDEIRMREEAQKRAEAIWTAAQTANDDHPYLARKNVRSFGLRVHKGLIVVPMRDTAGALRSLQFISPEGEKRFLTGGQKRGCYATIGKPGEKIFIAEGYATAATIHEATGEAVVVAFDAGNLEPVARAMREKFADLEIIITADNDRATKGNPGLTQGAQAAAAVGGRMIYPDFADEAPGSDFNDLAISSGYEAVMARIDPPANDNVPAPARTSTIDFYSLLPDCTDRGKPLSTIENLEEICRRLGVIIRYNVITKEEEIIIPDQAFSIDNGANASLAWLVSWCGRFKMPTGQIGDFVTYLADQNLYNPVANWITSKPWDGVSRLDAFFGTVKAVGEDTDDRIRATKETLMRRWMISAIAAAFRPNGVSAHGVLVFQGAQYLGKTAWFKRLVPASLNVISDGLLLDPRDRDSIMKAVSNWLVELGEVDATFRKADIAQLKAFITKDRDVLRRAYAKRESHFARRTVFFASVNPREYLHDPTGNRRFWTIECEHINHGHDLEMQQVWAEVFELFQAGETWFLMPEEMASLNEHNKDFEVRDPIEERIRSRLDWASPDVTWRWCTVTDVLAEIGIDRPTHGDVTKAGNMIRSMNGGQSKKSNGLRLLLAPGKYSSEPF